MKKLFDMSDLLFIVILSIFMILGIHDIRKPSKTNAANITQIEKRLVELEKQVVAKNATRATITAYTPSKDECGDDPKLTASMQKVKPGQVAVSRDLLEQGWSFGKRVYIENHGIFTIADLMHKRHINTVDILLFSKSDAKKFGIKHDTLVVLLEE